MVGAFAENRSSDIAGHEVRADPHVEQRRHKVELTNPIFKCHVEELLNLGLSFWAESQNWVKTFLFHQNPIAPISVTSEHFWLLAKNTRNRLVQINSSS